MPDKAKMKAIVDRGDKAFADLDKALVAARKAAQAVEKVIEDGVAANMVAAAKGKELINLAHQIVGPIGQAGELAGKLHGEASLVATKQGLPLRALATAAGVMLPESGGGR